MQNNDIKDLLRSVLYGIAIGDAVGNPIEFRRDITPEVFRRSVDAPVLRVSDDTQMTLFCMEALHMGGSHRGSMLESFKTAYLRWYLTQSASRPTGANTGLLKYEELYSVEAPGRTCMSSVAAMSLQMEVTNDSKGNGTVMRCAPVAFWSHLKGFSSEVMLTTASDDAATTHKHPYAAQSSKVLTALYSKLIDHVGPVSPEEFELIVVTTLGELERAGEICAYIRTLCASMFSVETYVARRTYAGTGGWVAEEALALAIGAVAHSKSYMGAIELAISFDGDSDTIGGIAGGLAAALKRPVPQELIAKINVREAIEYALSNYL